MADPTRNTLQPGKCLAVVWHDTEIVGNHTNANQDKKTNSTDMEPPVLFPNTKIFDKLEVDV
jgi:hypothetical protein